MTVDFWFDPSCPWTWATSRWLAAAAGERGEDVRWRPYSLALKNGLLDAGSPPAEQDEQDEHDAESRAGHRLVRVAARVAGDGADAAGRLYAELGRRIHDEGRGTEGVDLGAALEAAGLDPALASSADDESLDDAVRASMDDATRLVGDDVGVPVLAVDGRGLSGPILSPVPTGDAALRLFDAVLVALAEPGFFELKRTRDVGPALPPPA